MAILTTTSSYDVLSAWGTTNDKKKNKFEKLHVESNPVLTSIFQMDRIIPIVVEVKKMTQQYIGLDVENLWGLQ